jgi:DNA polymerase-3 subunit alpha
MTAVLQAESGDDEKVPAIVHECRRIDIDVLPPDINESFRNFAMVSKQGEKGRIRFGLSGIKNVGEHICDVIYRERKERGPYLSLEDLLTRVQDKDLNKKSLESLIQCGALDCFSIDRGVLLFNIEQLLFFARQSREHDVTKQDSLFAGTAIAVGNKLVIRSAPPATLEQKLQWEKKLLGLYVSSHPFLNYSRVLGQVLTAAEELEGYARDSWIIVGGIIQALKKMITKKGSVMMFATIEDLSGSVEVLVFPKTYESTMAVWEIGHMVCVVGKTPKEEGDNKVFAENVHLLHRDNVSELARQLSIGRPAQEEKSVKQPEKSVTITISKNVLEEMTKNLKLFFDNHPGEHRVILNIGGKIVRTNTFIGARADELSELETMVGTGAVVENI